MIRKRKIIVLSSILSFLVFGGAALPAEAFGSGADSNGTENKAAVEAPTQEKCERQIELLRSWIMPQTAEEAVQTWAKAVKQRNGAVQYAVLSPALQKATLKTYEDLNWVTGVSSPWVDSYKISKPGKAKDKGNSTKQIYEVTFQLATSSGSAGSGTVTVTVEQLDNNWVITGLSGNGSDQLNGIVIFPQ